MFATNSIATMNVEAGSSRKAENISDASAMGQDGFMTLLLAQLRNQDPLKPIDNTEFLGQLAQINTVSGVQDVSRSVGELAASMRSSQVVEAASLVGRSVLSAGSRAALDASADMRGVIDVPGGASDAALLIRDSAGALVRRLPLDARGGRTEFSWDGTTDRGTRAPAGIYQLEASGRCGDRLRALDLQVVRRVDSVTIDPSGRGLTLNTAAGSVAIGDVRQVL